MQDFQFLFNYSIQAWPFLATRLNMTRMLLNAPEMVSAAGTHEAASGKKVVA